MRKFLSLLICISFYSYSCTSSIAKNEIFQNDKIDPAIKAEIEAIDKQAYKNMCDNNYGALSQSFSDSLLFTITPDFAQRFMPQIQRVIKGKEFKVFDDFYIRTVKRMDSVSIPGGKADHAYTLRYITGSNETCISMVVAGDSVNEVMLTFIYIKVDGKWKMNNIQGEDFSLAGRNAVDQYLHAKKLYENGHLIDAVNTMQLTSHCIAPGGRMFSYTKQKEMSEFYEAVTKAVNAKYPLPYAMTEVATKPKMVNIHLEVMDRRFVPMILYQSSLMLADTVSLKKENDEMQQKIGKIFFGIDKNNPVILYRAYNELPEDNRSQKPYYGYVQKFK